MPSSDDLTNDQFGFSCYTFVFPASPEVKSKVDAIERASKMTRAKIPAHITVKGTFHGIDDLVQVISVARQAIKHTHRFWISFDRAELSFGPASGFLNVEATPEMQRLHDELVRAFQPLTTTVYPDDPYRTHMTLYQQATEDGLPTARALAESADFGPGFNAYAVDLMGRQGPANGGTWELVERFPIE